MAHEGSSLRVLGATPLRLIGHKAKRISSKACAFYGKHARAKDGPPTFGYRLHDPLFALVNGETTAANRVAITQLVPFFEPPIALRSVSVIARDWVGGVLRIELGIPVNQNNSRHDVGFPKYINEGTLVSDLPIPATGSGHPRYISVCLISNVDGEIRQHYRSGRVRASRGVQGRQVGGEGLPCNVSKLEARRSIRA